MNALSLESAKAGPHISEDEYEKQLEKLRAQLIRSQLALKNSPISVIIIISGIDGAGKGEVVNLLNEWLDPRHVDTHAFWNHARHKSDHPPYWKFWRSLPARGRIAVLFGSWYTVP